MGVDLGLEVFKGMLSTPSTTRSPRSSTSASRTMLQEERNQAELNEIDALIDS